eukprot:c2878_g1_i1.p1 GENE.c2878_g1_i1~~c2878_g1_i1.p1  ORF type:complete len:405 (+),score=108.66 c2878_g1_i1:147-1217(+)
MKNELQVFFNDQTDSFVEWIYSGGEETPKTTKKEQKEAPRVRESKLLGAAIKQAQSSSKPSQPPPVFSPSSAEPTQATPPSPDAPKPRIINLKNSKKSSESTIRNRLGGGVATDAKKGNSNSKNVKARLGESDSRKKETKRKDPQPEDGMEEIVLSSGKRVKRRVVTAVPVAEVDQQLPKQSPQLQQKQHKQHQSSSTTPSHQTHPPTSTTPTTATHQPIATPTLGPDQMKFMRPSGNLSYVNPNAAKIRPTATTVGNGTQLVHAMAPQHAVSAAAAAAAVAPSVAVTAAVTNAKPSQPPFPNTRAATPCRFGGKCRNPACPFLHPVFKNRSLVLTPAIPANQTTTEPTAPATITA